MALIFGLDIGTTSIGFAVIDHDPERGTGAIRRMGVRIFPEARDPKGAPFNQERRAARMRRRQLRRRRERRRLLGDILIEAGLLPARDSAEWRCLMQRTDPYRLRQRAAAGEALTAHELGRALYHLAQRRHFRGRDLDEVADDTVESERRTKQTEDDADEKKATSARKQTEQALERANKTLGAWLAERGPHRRKRGEHATRKIVEDEFNEIWNGQCDHASALRQPALRDTVHEAVFAQRPVFWRKKTLGQCRLIPGAEPCPKGSWLSQQRRMLEKLNNLEIAGGNGRPLDAEERAAILERLQTQASMTWPGVRSALAPLFKARGEPGAEKSLRFNLQAGGDKTLLGNPLEAKLQTIFGGSWDAHPYKQAIRDTVPARLRRADYREVGQRVVIRSAGERREDREAAVGEFMRDFGATEEQARELSKLKLPSGWEPFSIEALQAILPRLEEGVRFGALTNGPEWQDWRATTFPDREAPTGEVLDRLPSPADGEERKHIANLRNPTVARTRNELRKVVNNLIDMFGKPDGIRVELAREVGLSKREREERTLGMRRQEKRRKEARDFLEKRGIHSPSRDDIEKWLLWEECGHRCPYTGMTIGFDDLFGLSRCFEVEHIWPRSRSFDNSLRNKTLCHVKTNREKGNRTPLKAFGKDEERWSAIRQRLDGMEAAKGKVGMSRGKIRRFVSAMAEDFTNRQLNDTGYAARETLAFLKRLWPDVGERAPVTVQAVSGRVTGHLRRLWGLNNILSDDGEKTRADHRHHAIDALVVACAHPGMTQRLSGYWQAKDDDRSPEPPPLEKPWPTIRADADRVVQDIVVSHRVRKKVSGPLHKETVYGDTRVDEIGKDGTIYRYFVTRKKVEDLVMSEGERSSGSRVTDIVDFSVRGIVRKWIEDHGGNPKKAFIEGYPKRSRNGPEIRKVRVRKKQQIKLMARASTGYADRANNHHMAIYRKADGSWIYEVVSLMEASRRLVNGRPVVQRDRGDDSTFAMSLAPGDVVNLRAGKEAGRWLVHGISSAGRPTLSSIHDARPTTAAEADRRGMDRKRENFEPRFGGFMKRQPKKISIDPIGRVRPAND